MQTLAEKYLIDYLAKTINKDKERSNIINIGANKSLVIEKELDSNDCDYVEDRTDIISPDVAHDNVYRTYICSVEEMTEVLSSEYDIAFANFVLEHVDDLKSSASEINRILKKGKTFVTSIPNPQAPEFLISKITPHSFHQWIKGSGEGHEAHETKYSYKSIKEFINVFEENGFKIIEEYYRPFTYGYLYRFSVIKYFSRFYDYVVGRIGIKRFMGNVCLVFEKK